MQQLGLRSFCDEEDLLSDSAVPQSLETAVKSTQVAVVLFSEELFQSKGPLQDLRWAHSRTTILPVNIGLSFGRCVETWMQSLLALGMSNIAHAHIAQVYLILVLHAIKILTPCTFIRAQRDILTGLFNKCASDKHG